MTAYEAIFIVDSSLADDQLKAVVDKYAGLIGRNGGEVDDIDIWEPRRLAFEVKGRRDGRHIVMNFRSAPACKDELDRIFRISDDNLRFLVVKQDPRADRTPSKTRAADQERRERDLAARAATVTLAPQPVTEIGEPEAAAEEATEPAESAPSVETEAE